MCVIAVVKMTPAPKHEMAVMSNWDLVEYDFAVNISSSSLFHLKTLDNLMGKTPKMKDTMPRMAMENSLAVRGDCISKLVQSLDRKFD